MKFAFYEKKFQIIEKHFYFYSLQEKCIDLNFLDFLIQFLGKIL